MGDLNDIESRFIVWMARERGNLDYLAAYIGEDGTTITREIRTLLVEIIKGAEFKKPPGQPEKGLVEHTKLELAVLGRELELEYENPKRKQGRRKRAISDVAKRFGESESTVKRALGKQEPEWWGDAVAACVEAARMEK